MQRFAALLFSLFAASALAKEVSLFANEQAGTIVSSPDGEFTECRGPAQPSQGRTVEVVRHFASLRHSTCEWIAVTGRHDLDGPITYYRNGVDVVCVFELSRQSDAAATKRDSYATRLSSQGMAAVSIDKDEEETIAGKIFRHQILSGTPVGQMARILPRQRFHVWLWSAGTRSLELACYGPVAAVDGDLSAIRALAQSLRIGEPAAKAAERKP